MAEVTLAANNPDLGSSEQMLLRHAEALLELGHTVTVVVRDMPTEVLDAVAAIGAEVVAIRGDSRRDYLRWLRAWDAAERHGLLWCHGLVPAVATAGRCDRIVRLHQDPRSAPQRATISLARRGALATVVPSADSASRMPGSQAHANWTTELSRLTSLAHRPPAVGYLGRLSTDMGVDGLARAVTTMPGHPQLLLAGDARYVPPKSVEAVDAALAVMGDRAVRLGHLPPADLFARVAVVVFPSVWAEPFGLVVAEAMASGVPFVISDAGALPEVAGPDHPWVARAGDADDLARVITLALEATPETVRTVTDAARSRWESEYSPAAGRRRVGRLLEELGVS